MSDEHVDAPHAPPRNKGQSMIDSFRAARLAARPALRSDLLANRQTLHRQRRDRLARGSVEAARAQDPPEPLPAAPHHAAAEAPPRAEVASSIFAAYCDAMETPPEPPPQPRPPPPALAAQTAVVAAAPIPLSAIGFGPGMTIRMSQLGIESAADLAAADAIWLRNALGDLSDLVHAELWIASARKACADAAAATRPACVEID